MPDLIRLFFLTEKGNEVTAVTICGKQKQKLQCFISLKEASFFVTVFYVCLLSLRIYLLWPGINLIEHFNQHKTIFFFQILKLRIKNTSGKWVTSFAVIQIKIQCPQTKFQIHQFQMKTYFLILNNIIR